MRKVRWIALVVVAATALVAAACTTPPPGGGTTTTINSGPPLAIAGASPTVYEWEWELDGRTPIEPVTSTVEYGDDQRSGEFAYAHLNALKFEASRSSEGKVSGEMIGKEVALAASAVTGSLTSIAPIPSVRDSRWRGWCRHGA